MHKSLQECRVIFSNNIAETSLTIPRLTHVVDFTTCFRVQIDRALDIIEMKVDRCTKFAQLQRRGRLGRTSPGEYCAIYDPSNLSVHSPTSFDLQTKEHLLQSEMRLRHFRKCTLFKTITDNLSPIGKGLTDNVGISQIPTGCALEVGAELAMTPYMAVAFQHAVSQPSQKECALAIIWLAAMLESREPPVSPRTPLPKVFMMDLGQGGDQGVLLQLFKSYTIAKTVAGFDLRTWCRVNGNIQENFILSTESHIESILHRCRYLHRQGNLKKDPNSYRDHTLWRWDDIIESLAHG